MRLQSYTSENLHYQLLAIIASLRCQQFSNISPAPKTKQDKYFHKRGKRESASASKVGRGGGLGERRGFSFPIPAPNSRVCLKGSAKSARKIMVCTENPDQNSGTFQGLWSNFQDLYPVALTIRDTHLPMLTIASLRNTMTILWLCKLHICSPT